VINGTLQISSQAKEIAKTSLASLKKATDNIEAMFLKDLLTQMEKSQGTKMFGSGPGSDIYQDMMNQELTQQVAKGGQFGVSKMLYGELSPSILAQAEAKVRLSGGKP